MGAQCHLRTTVHTSRNSHGEVETLSFEDPNVSSKITIQVSTYSKNSVMYNVFAANKSVP